MLFRPFSGIAGMTGLLKTDDAMNALRTPEIYYYLRAAERVIRDTLDILHNLAIDLVKKDFFTSSLLDFFNDSKISQGGSHCTLSLLFSLINRCIDKPDLKNFL